MKFIYFLAVAFAALTMTGCSDKDDVSIDASETKSVFLQIETGAVSSRSVEGSADGTKAALLSAVIYFVDNSSDPLVYATRTVAAAGADATMEDLVKGVRFSGIPNSVRQVYVVGNYNSSDETASANFSTAAGIRLSDVKSTLLDIQQVAYPKLQDGTTSTVILTILDGTGTVESYETNPGGWVSSEATPGAKDMYAVVEVSPVNARIEMNRMKYTGDLVSFEVEGIYINNYYAKMPLSLSTASLSTVNNLSDVEKYDRSHADYAYGVYNLMADYVNESVSPSGGAATIAPTGGVWAYHIFGNHNPVPHIVVKLKDVTDTPHGNVGDRYLTVKGFRNTSTNLELNTLERGKIYQISSLEFDDDNLELLPETESVDLWVHVTVKDWETVPVSPIL